MALTQPSLSQAYGDLKRFGGEVYRDLGFGSKRRKYSGRRGGSRKTYSTYRRYRPSTVDFRGPATLPDVLSARCKHQSVYSGTLSAAAGASLVYTVNSVADCDPTLANDQPMHPAEYYGILYNQYIVNDGYVKVVFSPQSTRVRVTGFFSRLSSIAGMTLANFILQPGYKQVTTGPTGSGESILSFPFKMASLMGEKVNRADDNQCGVAPHVYPTVVTGTSPAIPMYFHLHFLNLDDASTTKYNVAVSLYFNTQFFNKKMLDPDSTIGD